MRRVKQGSILVTICGIAVILVVLLIQHSQAQRSEGGPPGGMPGGAPGGTFDMKSMVMGSLEKSWAYASFELGLADPVLLKAKMIYQKNWDELKKLAEKVEGATDRRQAMQEIRGEIEKLNADRHEKLKDAMLPAKLEKLIKWEEEQQQTQRRGPR